MPTPYAFNEQAAKRVVAAVRRVEAQARNTGGRDLPGQRVGPQQMFLARVKDAGAFTIDTTETCTVYAGTPGSEATTGFDLEVFNKFGTLAAISGGAWVWVAHNGYGWYVIAARC